MFPIKNYQGSKYQWTFPEQSSVAPILNEPHFGVFWFGVPGFRSTYFQKCWALLTKGGLSTAVGAQCLWKMHLKGFLNRYPKIRNSFWNVQDSKAAEASLPLTSQLATLPVRPSPAAAFKITFDCWAILFIANSASATLWIWAWNHHLFFVVAVVVSTWYLSWINSGSKWEFKRSKGKGWGKHFFFPHTPAKEQPSSLVCTS